MGTQIVKTTVYEIIDEWGLMCGRYSKREWAAEEIFWANRGMSRLVPSNYHIEEKTIETTYEVVYKKFRKNSRFEWYRGQIVKFLVKDGHTVYAERDGKLDLCSRDYL